MSKLPISVIVLTYNEENNIGDCLESVHGWVEDVFVVDSYSGDKTLEITRKYTDKIHKHPFENYSTQRNWALENLPIKSEWILNLDADHRVTEQLRTELSNLFSEGIDENIKGFLISRRTIFMGRWIKHGGHYPVYHGILFRKGYGYCENRLYDQHFVIEGQVKTLKADLIDIITDSLTKFVERHNKWATLEAIESLTQETSNKSNTIKPDIFGNAIEKRRFFRDLYSRLPLFIRSFLYFFYRYFLKFGFLDKKEGLIFHFLQGFWFRFLVDAKIYELRKRAKIENKHVRDVIHEL